MSFMTEENSKSRVAFSCRISSTYFNLKESPGHSSYFIMKAFLKTTGQLFCRISFDFGVVLCFLTITLGYAFLT